MIDELDLDWVHLCTPVQTHLPIAKLIIEAGIPVQIEKPITETYEEFEELAAHAERHGVTVTEVHNHNFVPAMREAMQMKRDGELGDVRGVDVIYTGSSRPDDPNRGPWNFDLAGGEFEEGLPHPIYLTLRAGGYPRSGGGRRRHDVAVRRVRTRLRLRQRPAPVRHRRRRALHDEGAQRHGAGPPDSDSRRGEVLTVDLISQTIEEHDRDYLASSVNRGLNNVDSVIDRITGTVKNVRSMVRSNRNDDWDTTRLNNPHFYQHDAEARALESGDEMPVPLSEARWTVYLMEAIRDSATQSERRELARRTEHRTGRRVAGMEGTEEKRGVEERLRGVGDEIAHRTPAVEPWLLRARDVYARMYVQRTALSNRLHHDAPVVPYRLLDVDPDDIEYVQIRRQPMFRAGGASSTATGTRPTSASRRPTRSGPTSSTSSTESPGRRRSSLSASSANWRTGTCAGAVAPRRSSRPAASASTTSTSPSGRMGTARRRRSRTPAGTTPSGTQNGSRPSGSRTRSRFTSAATGTSCSRTGGTGSASRNSSTSTRYRSASSGATPSGRTSGTPTFGDLTARRVPVTPGPGVSHLRRSVGISLASQWAAFRFAHPVPK